MNRAATLSGLVEVEDDATGEDIETAVREDMWDRLSLSWRERTTDLAAKGE